MHSHRLFVIAALAALACSTRDVGDSIGRPPSAAVVRPAATGLRLTEIYVATNDTGAHFAEVELDAAAAAPVDLAGLSACWMAGCVAVTGAVAPGARATVAIGALALSGSAGELALVDDEEQVAAYLAWGGDPAVFRSSWAARAVAANATAAGDYVPLPFPMPTGVAVAVEGDQRGCALPSPDAGALIHAGLCPETPSPLAIMEILPAWSPEGDSWIEVVNQAPAAVRLVGVRLCQMPGCTTFGFGQKIGALSRLLLHLGGEGESDAENLVLADAEPVRRAGELVLLAPGPAEVAAAPADMLSFVRYGVSAGGLSPAAVDGGLWSGVGDTASAPRITAESLSRDRSGRLAADAWNPTRATPLLENEDVGAASDLWTSCSMPRPWNSGPASPLVISFVARGTPNTLVLSNRSPDGLTVPLAGYTLALKEAPLDLTPVGELAAASSLIIELSPEDEVCEPTAVCWKGEPGAVIDAAGEASLLLYDAGTGVTSVVQHVQWGSAARVRAGAAVADGVWPLEECALPELAADTRWALRQGEVGQSPADWE
jgi:hypothetical protein